MKFHANEKAELQKAMYSIDAFHDAVYRSILYSNTERRIEIILENTYFKRTIRLTFDNVRFFLSLSGDPWRIADPKIFDDPLSTETINGICLQEDDSLPRLLLKDANFLDFEKMLYVNFEMFSGNQICILCEELTISESDL